MRLASRSEIDKALNDGEIVIRTRDGSALEYLDEYRVVLRLERLYSVQGEVDLTRPEDLCANPLDLTSATLAPNTLYLATTREVFTLGTNFVATIHTRSKFARAGFECLISSNFVVPGFGSREPTPLVLELLARLRTRGLSPDGHYFFVLLYRLDQAGETLNQKDYWDRFPLRSELDGLN